MLLNEPNFRDEVLTCYALKKLRKPDLRIISDQCSKLAVVSRILQPKILF